MSGDRLLRAALLRASENRLIRQFVMRYGMRLGGFGGLQSRLGAFRARVEGKSEGELLFQRTGTTEDAIVYDVRGERSAGWAGLAFVFLSVLGSLLVGLTPSPNVGGAALSDYSHGRHSALLLYLWLSFPESAFFLWFAVGMRAFLLQTPDPDEGLPTYALVTAIMASAVAMVGATLAAAFILAPTPTRELPALLYVLQTVDVTIIFMAFTPFVFACTHSMRRHSTGAAWLIGLGYLASILMGLSTLGILAPAGIFAPDGLFGYIAFFVLLLWIIGASLALIQARRTVRTAA